MSYEHLILREERNTQEMNRALQTQKQQLERWKKVLKSPVFKVLVDHIGSVNSVAKDADMIPRGDKIVNYVNLIKDGII